MTLLEIKNNINGVFNLDTKLPVTELILSCLLQDKHFVGLSSNSINAF